jgi:hypothetical protein
VIEYTHKETTMNEETIAALKKLVDEFYELNLLYDEASDEGQEDIASKQDCIKEEIFLIVKDNV